MNRICELCQGRHAVCVVRSFVTDEHDKEGRHYQVDGQGSCPWCDGSEADPAVPIVYGQFYACKQCADEAIGSGHYYRVNAARRKR